MLSSALAIVAVLAAPPPVFHSADGNTWRVTKLAGATPNSGYEQWYLHVERLDAAGTTLEVFNFEEVAWVKTAADINRSVRVEFSLDSKGVFQAEQRTTVQTRGEKPQVTVVVFRWDGKAFKATDSK